jgi:hypothetical protein
LVVAVQLIYVGHKKDWRTLGYSLFIPAVAYLPWLPQVVNQIKVTRTLQESFPGFANLLSVEVLRAPTLTLGKFIFGILPIEKNWFYLAILIILAGLLFGFLNAYPGAVWRYNRKKLLLLMGMLVCPLLLAVLASVAFPILQARRVIFLLPFFYVFLSYLLFGLETNKKITPWSYLTLSFLLLLNLYGTFIYYNAPSLQRENWRGVITSVNKSVPANQTLVIFPNLADFSPWQWYGSEQVAVLSLQSRNLNENMAALNLLGVYLDNYRYLVVFDYGRGIVDPNDLIGQQLAVRDFALLKDVGDEGVGSVNIYVKEN